MDKDNQLTTPYYFYYYFYCRDNKSRTMSVK